jgi:hypothetical protein
MKRLGFALSVLLILSAGCASTARQADAAPEEAAALAASGMPPLQAGPGRLVLLRTLYFGPIPGMKQPSPVLVDGKVAGTSAPGAYFFLDLPPGAHAVALAAPESGDACTPVEDSRTDVTVAEGEVTFVRVVGAWSLKKTVLKPRVMKAKEGWKSAGELKLQQPDCAANPQAHCGCGG